MQTRYNNTHENIVKITFDRVPETGTMSKLSAALDLIDSSVNALCDARITEALDTSSIQTLWSVFNEYDFVTSAALNDLNYRVDNLDSSLGIFDSQNRVKFSDLDSSASVLRNAITDVSNALIQHINDTSNNTGTLKPEDVEQYINPVRQDLFNTSVYLNGRIDNAVSQIIDCELDISTLYNYNSVRRTEINNVSTRLNTHISDYTQTVATVSNHTNQISELYGTTASHTTTINRLNSSVNALISATVENTSIWNNQAAPIIRGLNTSVNDLSTRFSVHVSNCASQSAVESLSAAIDDVNTSIGLIKYFDNLRDASIITLRDYQTNTVDSLLSQYAQRVNNAESIAVDSQFIANDVSARVGVALNNITSQLTADFTDISTRLNTDFIDISTRLNSGFSTLSNDVSVALTNISTQLTTDFIDISTRLNSGFVDISTRLSTNFSTLSNDVTDALNNYYDFMSEKELVTSRALVMFDSSINYILGILRNNGLIS